jgi:branched-chain amino acid transport system substrate-binding protein
MYDRHKLIVFVAVTTALFTLSANAAKPISIAVIAPKSTLVGRSIFQGAEQAASEINSNGGVNGRQIQLHKYDDHASATDSVRAFHRAVQEDHAIAVVGNYISEAAIATEPWAARLKEPYIVTGAASTKISARVHKDYDKYKYVFRVNLNSADIAKVVCAQSRDILVKQLHYKTAVIFSENYSWTKPYNQELKKCLPKAGLKVLSLVKFAPDTKDFNPTYQHIEKLNPDVMIASLAHVGVKPTTQWHQHEVPILLAGWSSQAGASSFWKDTNGAAQGEITGNYGAPGATVTDKSVPFFKAYTKRFNETPAYGAYTTYDAIYILKKAIERAGNTQADALVKALEKTDYTGTAGREVFYPKSSKFAHDVKPGKNYVPTVGIQWQDGKQVTIWPEKAATGKVILPSFVPKK